jgi:predicted CoA-binding protein
VRVQGLKQAMGDETYADIELRQILETTMSIAVVGLSDRPERPSFQVAEFLSRHGYKVFGVNPKLAGTNLFDTPVVADLASLPQTIDMVDIFRNSQDAGAIVDDALALAVHPKTIWMQLDVSNPQAALRAREAGVKTIMNRCPKIEYARLMRSN